MMKQESGYYRPEVVWGNVSSTAGAVGIAQFLEGTARDLRVNPLDPGSAIPGAASYLAAMTNYFGGDIEKGAAAYNYGPGNLTNTVNRADAAGVDWHTLLPAETRHYVDIASGRAQPGSPNPYE